MRPSDRTTRSQPLLRRAAATVMVVVVLALAPGAALADDYDPRRSGHPLRIVAYILHPVGVIVDRVFFRPLHWLGHHEPLHTLFGHDAQD